MNNPIELRFGAPRLPLIDYSSVQKTRNPLSPKAKKVYMPRIKPILDFKFNVLFDEFGIPATGCICHLLNPYMFFCWQCCGY